MPRVLIHSSAESLDAAVVDEIHEVLKKTTLNNQVVTIGLSGGSMPDRISPGLLSLTDVDWNLVHFFFCDERVVPFDHPESTFGVYYASLFSRLSLAPHVHPIDLTAPTTEACAAAYQQDLLSFFGAERGFPEFDLLLLGLGPDGHTCSLFPSHVLLSVEDLVVAPITDSPKPPPNRVTLTLPVLNKAKRVLFIVTGGNKADVVKKIIEETPNVLYPASMVQPLASKPSWHLDEDAAKLLKDTFLLPPH